MENRSNKMPWARRLVLVAIVCLVTGCASRPPILPVDAERHPRRVAIIPVRDSDEVSIDRSSLWFLLYGGIGIAVERIDMVQKRRVFEAKFAAATRWIGPEMTEALRAGAAARGLDVVVLNDIVRDADDPEDFDYQKIATDADVVIHARVRDIGLFSTTFSPDYVPKLEVSAMIVGHRTGVVLLDESFHYGARGTRQAFWAVPADDRYRFGNFDVVLDQVSLVDEGWHAGAKALGTRIAEQLGNTPAR